MLVGVIEKAGELRVEVADTNESKELLKFCRKLTVPLRSALREQKILSARENAHRPVVHVFFIAPGCCYVGYSYSNNNSPFYMGILDLNSLRCTKSLNLKTGRGIPCIYPRG